ncbi:hypothetical protein ACLOJK_009320 [Asimina triloba]
MASASPSETPATSDTEIQPSNLQSTDDIAPVAAEEEKEAVAAGEAIQPSDAPSTDEGDSIQSNKRKTPEGGEGEETGSSLHPLWKTSLCSFFRRQSGSCSHGDACRFAHSEAELRPRPDNSWDPTSERAKKLLKSDNGEKVRATPEVVEDVLLSVPLSDNADALDTGLSRCIVHLPRRWTSDNLKSFLNNEGIHYTAAKKKKGMVVGFVGFENAEQIKEATKVLDGKSIGSKKLKVANVIPRSYERKQNVQPEEDHSGGGNSCASPGTAENDDILDKDGNDADGSAKKLRSARDVVTPLAHMPYNNQREHKKNSLVQILKRLVEDNVGFKLKSDKWSVALQREEIRNSLKRKGKESGTLMETRNARKACPDGIPLPEWIHKSREIGRNLFGSGEGGGLPCKLEGILESPLVDGYRNKCEFSVGYSPQGKRTVGFMLGNFRDGMITVAEPFDCPNVSTISCKYAAIFQEFLQSSVLPVWDRINNTGFWRQLTVREGRSPHHGSGAANADGCIAEVMLIVQVCTTGVENDILTGEFQRMAQAFSNGASACSPPLPLTSLVVQDHTGISNAAPSDCPLLPLSITNVDGVSNSEDPDMKTRIHDYIGNLQFSISPTAFFQVNTLAAEKLYSLAGDWATLGPDTLLFDICCGTGTIGLTLAHRVGMVVGIEMNASAVSDAQRNAKINGIENCRFVCAKAEDVISSLLQEYLTMPPEQDKTLQVSEINIDGVPHHDDLSGDASACLNTENVESTLKCSTDRSNGRKEAGQQTMEAAEAGDTVKEDAIDATMPNENLTPMVFSVTEDASMPIENVDGKMASIGADAFIPSESLDQEAADVKRTPANQQGSLEGLDSQTSVSEENITTVMPVGKFKHVVAIVDPPRVGLHPIVIKALRTHPCLRRLVYISCNPESLVANAIELCTPSPDKPDKVKNNRGWRNMSSTGLARYRAKSMPNSEPFRPVKAMAVDLFPHTPHCEMVMLLER